MRPSKKVELQEKGWKEAEIKHAEAVLERDDRRDLYLMKIVFWSALLVIVFANLIVALLLIPFLIVLEGWSLYLIVVILGVMVGFLYNFLITDIGHLQKRHHLLAGIIVPLLALSNMVITIIISNRFITDLKISQPHHSIIIGIVFAAAFILPYLLDRTLIKSYK